MKQRFLLVFVVLATIVFSSCSNENTTQESDVQSLSEVTEFASVDSGVLFKTKTRTTGIYDGFKIKFYWTSGDKLWINNPTAPSVFTQSVKDDIDKRIAVSKDGKSKYANFYFSGTLTANSYKLRYTGKGNPASDKVTIKSQQTQQLSNDASHIGEDGDCGTATANKNGGRYEFTLDHKSAYLTFTPYYSKDELDNSVTVKSIKVTANENLAGTFDFNDNGLQTASVTAPSKSVTLALTGAFNIPKAINHTKNAAIMVVAPGTYTNFTVEYTLADSQTGVTGTVSKTYSSVTLNAGKNVPVKFDLAMENYGMDYYMWDAGKPYWDGYTGKLPVKDGEQAPYEASGTNRYFNGDGINLYAVNACKVCPNANEAALYVFRGDPHWDETTLWVKNKHLYKGGMWFLKLKYCDRGPYKSPVTTYPDGVDYRANSYWATWDESTKKINGSSWVKKPGQGRPADTSKYFYLPAMGYLDNDAGKQGVLKLNTAGYQGAYWTSTSVVFSGWSRQAISLHFSKDQVGLDADLRLWSYPIFTVADK